MTRSSRARLSAYRWRYVLPAVAAPIGGGIIKIGQASTWAAVSVGLAPYVVVASLYALFMIGYIPAVFCYLCSNKDRQDAINRLITTSADAIISLLTLTPVSSRHVQFPGDPNYRSGIAPKAAPGRNRQASVRRTSSDRSRPDSAHQAEAESQRAGTGKRADANRRHP